MPETPQGREPLGGVHGMLVTLAGDVRVLSEKLKTVEVGLAEHEHTSDVQSDLAEKVEKLSGEVEKLLAVQKPTVWDWSTMELDEAAKAWEILSGWVQAVLTDQLMVVHWNVPTDDKPNKLNEKKIEKPQAFSPCWRQHRDVIWLLTPLCQSWLEIHGSGGKATAALEWQARQLPAVIARLALSSAQWCVLGCQLLASAGAGWHLDDVLTRVTEEERTRDRARLAAEAKRLLAQTAKR